MILEAKNLSKEFRYPIKQILFRDISLSVKKGETLAIVGRSGEGKTTLLQILGTLDKPTSGTLSICGKDTATANCNKIRNSHIGFIFQSFHLLEDETALQNVLLPSSIARKAKSATPRAKHLLEQVGLQERKDHQAKLLSGGEKQRVAIARALMNDPDLILADEPTGNLDSTTSEMIHHLLIELTKKFNKSLIIVTHDKKLASLCEKVYRLENGKLIQDNLRN